MISPGTYKVGGSAAGTTGIPAASSNGTPGDTPWFHRFEQAPFPVAILPPWLAEYVNCLADHFLLDPSALAPLILAQLAGVLAEYRQVRSTTGASVSLPFCVVAARRENSTLSMALAESGKTLAELQRAHLDAAACFDHKRAKELMQKPRMLLPTDALPTTRYTEPREVDKWRARLVRLIQQPLFWLEAPGAKELRAGFVNSFDRTLLVTFAKGGWLEKLVALKRDREANRLGELLMHLVQGGHITVPGSPKNPAAPRLAQARFGLVGLTASATLAQALRDEREDVHALLAHSVLLNLSQVASSRATTRPSPERLQKVGASWKHRVTCLLTERRAAEPSGIAPHDTFYEHLMGWQVRLHAYSQHTPASLQGHLAAFADLPLKLGGLLLAIGQYGVWKDAEAAQAALRIAEWMLGRTLSCADAVQEDHRRHIMGDARERMFAKIAELGPIDFWRLCRRFDKQTKALHEPTLHALLEEKRVCLNAEGKLVAV